jgi:hypothetical protein
MIAINMEMPKSCADCERGSICGYGLGYGRPDDCPLVEIVTCKDCKHWDKEWTPNVPDDKEYHYCWMMDCNTSEDFYCADAERRE